MYLPTRTSATSPKPSALRPCRTVTPCGSLTTGLGITTTRAITWGDTPPERVSSRHARDWGDTPPQRGCRRPRAGPLRLRAREQGPAGQALVRDQVALAGLLHDVVGQRRRRRLPVPAALADQPVADELLVERLRGAADLPGGGVPEARAVGRERLVDQDQPAVDLAELELGVSQDQALALRVRGRLRVQPLAGVAQPLRQLAADVGPEPVERDVLIVPRIRLGGRREDRLRQPLALAEAGRQRLARHGAPLAVLGPGAPGEVAADDALEVDPPGAPDDNRAAAQLGWQSVVGVMEEVVLYDVARAREPEPRELRQHPAPVGDPGRQDVVERRNPVGRDDQEPFGI